MAKVLMARKKKTDRQTKTPTTPPKRPKTLDQADLSEDRIQQIVVTAMQSFSGPLPPPEMLDEYENVLEGAADRIVCLAEKEQKIRAQDNQRMITRDIVMIVGSVVVSLAVIGGIVTCAYFGELYFGLILGFGLFPAVLKSFSDLRRLLSYTTDKSG